jgi:GT2 family glycosyltransferase
LSGVAQPRIAVAIVSWNTRDLLARSLESFTADAQRGLAEVWVVDNASEDASADMVRERFPWVRLVASEENLGFGRAVNLVARRTTTEWIAPANADIAVRDGALGALLAAGERDPGAGAIAPRLILPDGSTQHSVFGFPTIPFALLHAGGVARLLPAVGDRIALPGQWDTERARRVPWAVAAFLLVRRSAWDRVGGFDERQWMYAEDLDLGWRLRESGFATRYEPRAHVDHESAAATSQYFGDDLSPHWQRSTYGFLARRRGAGYAWAVGAIEAAGALVRSATATDAHKRRSYARWARLHLGALRSGGTLRRYR